MRWFVVLCLAGCLRTHYRYIDLPLPPDQATAELAHEAARADLAFVRGREDCAAVYCDPANLSLWRTDIWTSFRLAPHGSGSRLEIAYSNTSAVVLTPELSRQPITEVHPRPYEPGWADWLVTDFEVSGEVESDPRIGLGWRTNFAGQVGPRLGRWGQLGDDPRIGHSVSLLAGPGVTVSSTGMSLLAEMTLSFDRQALVEPMPGEHLPMGPRDALDVTVAGRFFDDEHDVGGTYTRRNGLEVGLTARRVGLGGLTLRAGYLWGPGGGKTLAIGVRALDPMRGYIVALGAAALFGLAMAVTHPGPVTVSGG